MPRYAEALRVLRSLPSGDDRDDAAAAADDDARGGGSGGARRAARAATALYNAANALRDAGDLEGAVELLVEVIYR